MEIQKVTPLADKKLQIIFKDGQSGILDINEYFELSGVLEILQDDNMFKKVTIKNNCLHWTDDCELSPETLYAIIANKKIFIDGKVVFDPALKKKAWNRDEYR
jgi:hypothetical protein